ncbi:MAG: 30S ribosomal protein S6--L-glutamate ligase, partial [Muricauda sp.]|nr:30S ribosomal protein S6--L-glutamate ligase [Allomuricauda sp.]
HRGAETQTVELTPREKFIAINAAKHLGLDVAGVDLIRSNDGPLLIEVNASPGLKGIEAATGINVAGHIVQFVEKYGRRNRK